MAKYLVRFGVMRLLGVFGASGDQAMQRGAEVIIRTDRGLEAGEVLCEATPAVIQGLKEPPQGQILRRMSAEDAHEQARIREQARGEFQTCKRCIAEAGLEMELVDVEHIFGGERIVVYYLAEGRIDFRQLVKTLAGEFQTRIEMRQIGVRDEAKLLADYGDCGKSVCCNSHLIEMPPVSMKMAKVQKATLDPTKISGRCGRLKCCLRYEYDTYEELQKSMLPVGSRVMTASGRAKVIGHEILAQQLLVETEDRRRMLVPAADATLAPNDPPGVHTEPKAEGRPESRPEGRRGEGGRSGGGREGARPNRPRRESPGRPAPRDAEPRDNKSPAENPIEAEASPPSDTSSSERADTAMPPALPPDSETS